jgi:hypothetical protein
MDLRHYASHPVTLEMRTHEQTVDLKPSGLWLSVDTEWLDWCRSEDFRTDLNWYEHAVTLSPEANILALSSATDLDAFTAEYGEQVSPRFPSRYIDWSRVADVYDGIVIAPYQWSRRLERHTFWYYGWDIASGCIWNPTVVSLGEATEVSFEQVQS